MPIKHSVIPFPSASRTATVNGADQETEGAHGVHLVLDVTAVTGTTPTLDVTIERKDPLSGVYTTIPGAVFTQKTVISVDALTIYPGIAVAANESVNDALSEVWRAVATITGTTPDFTFSLAGSLIP